MPEEKGYASLMEAYLHDLKKNEWAKEELDEHLQWVLGRADAYASFCHVTRRVILDGWEAKRNCSWLDYYQEHKQPHPQETTVLLYADWLKEGARLYGPDMLDWRVMCPCCRHVQALKEFREHGINEDYALANCASHFGIGGDPDCKYTSDGRFDADGVYVLRPDYVPVYVFVFADESPVEGRVKVGDVVRLYYGVNRPMDLFGEVKEVLPDGTAKVFMAKIDIETGKALAGAYSCPLSLLAVDEANSEKLRQGKGGVIFL